MMNCEILPEVIAISLSAPAPDPKYRNKLNIIIRNIAKK